MTTMGLSQCVIGPTHEKGHTLDLVFTTGLEGGGLDVEGAGRDPIVMVRPLPGQVQSISFFFPLQGWGIY